MHTSARRRAPRTRSLVGQRPGTRRPMARARSTLALMLASVRVRVRPSVDRPAARASVRQDSRRLELRARRTNERTNERTTGVRRQQTQLRFFACLLLDPATGFARGGGGGGADQERVRRRWSSGHKYYWRRRSAPVRASLVGREDEKRGRENLFKIFL